jgi:hypothetical protein
MRRSICQKKNTEALQTLATDSSNDMVLTLDHAARIGACHDMTEAYVVRKRAEERNSVADEHRQTADDQTVYEPGAQELLNRDPAVHVETTGTGSSKLGNNLCWSPAHPFNNASTLLRDGQIEGPIAQDDHSLLAVMPLVERQDFLKRSSTYDDGINIGNELVVPVLRAVASAFSHQPVQIAVRPRNKSIQANADKDRVVWAEIDREARKGKPLPSDHAPLVIDIDSPGHPFDAGWTSAGRFANRGPPGKAGMSHDERGATSSISEKQKIIQALIFDPFIFIQPVPFSSPFSIRRICFFNDSKSAFHGKSSRN